MFNISIENIEILNVYISDLDELQEISRTTFLETFAEQNSESNMNNYIEYKLSKEKLMSEIQNPDTEFYFVRFNGNSIGYLKLNYGKAQTEFKNTESVEIERIYLLDKYIGKGIGKKLLNFSIELSESRDAKYIWLGVWEKNYRAIAFYKRNGFVEFDQHVFILGDDHQIDILMKLNIDNNHRN